MNLVWLRRDLRLKDNRALAAALAAEGLVQPLFIFDPDILEKLPTVGLGGHVRKDARVDFIHEVLGDLDENLKKRGGKLWVFHGRPLEVFAKVFRDEKPTRLFFANDYEPEALARDKAVTKLAVASGVAVHAVKDQVIFEKDEVLTDQGKPYGVYGAYRKKWMKQLRPADLERTKSDGANLDRRLGAKSAYSLPTLAQLGFEKTGMTFPPAGFPRKLIETYDKTRDLPALKGTSRLGLHLRFGTVSVRELTQVAKELNSVFLGELIWREFFMQILFHHPTTVTKPYRAEFAQMPWRNAAAEFKLWCEGRTGVPIVDAGMRQLNATGFMHNRVRMITASYLTKHLLMDWRKGERYFAEKLLDYELSSNVGNWQWVAGSGLDAAPYFRIFNPELQAKRFDAKGEYQRRWVPELGSADYPAPIISNNEGRDRALRAYHGLRKKKS